MSSFITSWLDRQQRQSPESVYHRFGHVNADRAATGADPAGGQQQIRTGTTPDIQHRFAPKNWRVCGFAMPANVAVHSADKAANLARS
jgi:hypothetical protein